MQRFPHIDVVKLGKEVELCSVEKRLVSGVVSLSSSTSLIAMFRQVPINPRHSVARVQVLSSDSADHPIHQPGRSGSNCVTMADRC